MNMKIPLHECSWWVNNTDCVWLQPSHYSISRILSSDLPTGSERKYMSAQVVIYIVSANEC